MPSVWWSAIPAQHTPDEQLAFVLAPEPEALSARTTQLVADLVQPAKAEALEKCGEGQRALDIANAWVRTKLASKAADLA